MSEAYTNIFVRNTPEPVYCYRSDLTVYEERFLNGMLVPGGWNTAGYPLNVLSNCPTYVSHPIEPSVFHVELDGQCLDYRLQIKNYETISYENGSKEAVLTLTCDFKQAEIIVHTLLDGTPMFTRWLEIRNLSDKPAILSRLSVFSGVAEHMESLRCYGSLAVSQGVYELGYFEKDAGCMEGDLVWRSLPYDKTSIAGRFNRQRHRHPAFFLKNKLSGMIFFGQMAWSGGYEFSFDTISNRESNSIMMDIDMAVTGFKPLYIIAPGESFVSPEVHIGALIGDLDDAVNASYDHIRRSVLNLPEACGDACLVGAGMGPEHDMSVETTKRFMDQMAEVGAELFIVDAGWYCPPNREGDWWRLAGNWQPDPERYPNGIAEIRDYAHSKGLKFGMWMESERVGNWSVCREEHPEWFPTDAFGACDSGLLDFTNPEAAAWAEEEVARIITECELDLFRIDYNTASNTMFYIKEGLQPECAGIRHNQAVYAMYQRLKKRFPHVIFENCAGGGGRTDLGMLRAFNHTWVSDWQKAPRSLYITAGMTTVLPPERVDRLVAGMGCHAYASLDFQMRNAMLGHLTLNVFSPAAADWNPKQLNFITHSVSLYKDFIRPFLPTARMYHHNGIIPVAEKEGHCALELTAADKTRAALAIFRLPEAPIGPITILPRGLDAEKTYCVTFDNTGSRITLTGYELMSHGITVTLAVMTSELVLFEAV